MGSASSSTHWCHPGNCHLRDRPCLICHSGSSRSLRGRVMPIQWLIHTGKGVSCVFCQCLIFKNMYLLVFPEGKDNSVGAEEAKVWFVILRKSSWMTLKWHNISVPQFPTSKMSIVAALTERCAGRTQSNIYEVFEYHNREGRGA